VEQGEEAGKNGGRTLGEGTVGGARARFSTVQSTFTAGPLLLRMKMRFSSRALVLAGVIVAAMAAAVPPARADEDRHPIALAASMSLDQAVKMAEQRFQARVVRAEAQQNGGSTIYVLRMLNESGRVWIVRVDASNGAVL
jgi:hypothetical protein